MLDMGFIHDIKRILPKLPTNRQTLFFSATMPGQIQELAGSILRPNPVKVAVTPVSSTADTVTQAVYMVEKNDKPDLLEHVLQDKNIRRVLVFTRTKHGADKVVRKMLAKANIRGRSHPRQQVARTTASGPSPTLKPARTRVLVATDIAARGIDVDELTHVINYEIPERARNLRAPHWPHRPGRGRRHGPLLLRGRGARLPPGYSEADSPPGARGAEPPLRHDGRSAGAPYGWPAH